MREKRAHDENTVYTEHSTIYNSIFLIVLIYQCPPLRLSSILVQYSVAEL